MERECNACRAFPLPIQIGAGVSPWAVGRAIYKIAVTIDDYNDCMDESGGSGQPLIFEFPGARLKRVPYLIS